MAHQQWHGVQLWCMSRTISMGNGTLFGRVPFLVPLSDGSESCLFFPMVTRWRAVVRVGAEVSVMWAIVGRHRSPFKWRARAGHDAFDGGAEVDPPPSMAKAATQTR
jgi:hypothetical protein